MSLAILSILGYCMALTAATRRRASEFPPVVVAGLTLVLYAGALAGALRGTALTLLWGGLALLVLTLLRWAKPTGVSRCEWGRRALPAGTTGLVVFVSLAAVGSCLCASAAYWDWDEFSHWGLAAKMLGATHRLWDNTGVIACPDYPPATALFQYWALAGGPFDEGRTIAAQFVFTLAFLVPLMRTPAALRARPASRPFVRWLAALAGLSVPVLGFAGLLWFGYGCFSLYVDGLLGIVLGATVASYAVARPGSPWQCAPAIAGLAILPLIKVFGLLLALVAAGAMVWSAWGTRNPDFDIPEPEPNRLTLLLLPLLPLAVYGTWQWHLTMLPARPPVAQELQPIEGPLVRLPASHYAAVAVDFLRSLATKTVGCMNPRAFFAPWSHTHTGRPASLPTWCTFSPLVWAALLSLAGGIAARRAASPERQRVWRLMASMALGFALYLAALLAAYLLCFPLSDALHLASFGRYVGTYVLAWLLVVFATGNEVASGPWTLGRTLLTATVAGGMALAGARFSVAPVIPPLLSERRAAVQSLAARVSSATPEEARIYHVSQDPSGLTHVMMRYELAPRRVQSRAASPGPTAPDGSARQLELSADAWAALLNRYDYVAISGTDARFRETYGALFAPPDAVLSGVVFRVASGGPPGIRLVPAAGAER